jgi:hypothetical protein
MRSNTAMHQSILSLHVFLFVLFRKLHMSMRSLADHSMGLHS